MGKAEQTRQFIIETAAPIFNKYGYEGTSMSQLTRAVRMTKGAVYGNFKDKNEIALAAFEHNMIQMTQKIKAAVLAQTHTCDKLIAFAGFYLDHFVWISENGGCPVLNAGIDSDNAHPQLKEQVVWEIENWMDNIVEIISSGTRKKEIRADADPEEFASMFISLIEGGMMLSKITGSTSHLAWSINHIISLVNQNLRT